MRKKNKRRSYLETFMLEIYKISFILYKISQKWDLTTGISCKNCLSSKNRQEIRLSLRSQERNVILLDHFTDSY